MEKRSKEARTAYDLVQSEGGIIDTRGDSPNNLPLQRSSSVEHMYEATPMGNGTSNKNSVKPRATKSTNNSPHIVRKFDESQKQELSMEGSGQLNDSVADSLYAQVIDTRKPGKKTSNADDVSKTDSEPKDVDTNTANHRVHNGKTLVVTYHALPTKDPNTMEEVISSGDIEHTVTGNATYALVQTIKKKKKKNKLGKEDSGEAEAGESDTVGVSSGGKEADTQVEGEVQEGVESGNVAQSEEPEEKVKENSDNQANEVNCSLGDITEGRDASREDVGESNTGEASSTPVDDVSAVDDSVEHKLNESEGVDNLEADTVSSTTGSVPVAPPPKPRRSIRRKPDNIINSRQDPPSPGGVSNTSPTATKSTPLAGEKGARVKRNPIRQAPPPPPGRKKSPPPGRVPPPVAPYVPPPSRPPPSEPPPSKPPAFPPPPPPSFEVDDHTYAMITVKTSKPNKVDASALIDMWLADDASNNEESVNEENDQKNESLELPTNNSLQEAQNSAKSSSALASVSPKTSGKSNSLPRGSTLQSSLKKDKMKRNPALPPRHTPPPPPPPGGAGEATPPVGVTVLEKKAEGAAVTGNNKSGPFLFDSGYASHLISVRDC